MHFSNKARRVRGTTCSVEAVGVLLCYVNPVVLVPEAALTCREYKTEKNISTVLLFIILFVVGKIVMKLKLFGHRYIN